MTLTSATITPSTLVTVACGQCGAGFQAERSRAKHGRGKHCSPACQYAAIKARAKAATALTCVGCGSTFHRAKSLQALGRNRFCTRVCRDRNRVRELHPQYKGRPVHHRGANWPAQKRKAKARDGGLCQHCGAAGRDVHHIRPYRLFIDYREANDLGNLVTLCKPCHRRADALVQRVA